MFSFLCVLRFIVPYGTHKTISSLLSIYSFPNPFSMSGATGGYAVRPTFGIRLHRRSTGASFSNPCCGLEIQPIRETNLGCGMKRSSTGECFPSIYPSIYIYLSLSLLSIRYGGMSCRLLCPMYAYMRRLDENREIIAEIQHVRCKCSLYDPVVQIARQSAI